MKRIRKGQGLLISFIALLFVILSPNPIFASDHAKVMVDGDSVQFDEKIFQENSRVYIPLRFVAEKLGAKVEYVNRTQTVNIHDTIGDSLSFKIDSKKVTLNGQSFFMDVAPIIRNDRTYLPIRHIAELMHSNVSWNEVSGIAEIESVAVHEIQSGESLAMIAQQYGITIQQLKARNGLKENEIQAGATLKIVIPQFIKDQKELAQAVAQQAHPDLDILAKLIEAESEGEPFKGKVAVGSVVVNRTTDSRFPPTIKGVIYQENQFTPVKTGRINKVTPSAESIEAAKLALAGEKPVSNALFFFNPSLTNDSFLKSKPVVAKIGNHQFVR